MQSRTLSPPPASTLAASNTSQTIATVVQSFTTSTSYRISSQMLDALLASIRIFGLSICLRSNGGMNDALRLLVAGLWRLAAKRRARGDGGQLEVCE